MGSASMSEHRAMRVFVTGVGMVSPLSVGARATMDLLVRGARAFRKLTLFDAADQRTAWAAEVSGLRAADVAPEQERQTWSRTDAMAVLAAREALGEARLEPARVATDLVFGGTTGGMFETEELLAQMHRDPARQEPILQMLSHPLSATSDRLQTAVGPFRRAHTICSACSGGANAILLGALSIRTGSARRVLAGGADGLCRLTFTGFNALGAVALEPCRPFDARRSGLTLGEGAAFLVIEDENSALERGARPIAEITGWGVGAEAHHITNPEAGGVSAAALIEKALARGGIAPAAIDYVNAHGTGTPLNDAMETAAIDRALGRQAERVLVSSSKGQLGHTLGASGAIEAAITVLAMERGEVPPTGGLEQVDDACRLRHVTREGRPAALRAALSNSFGFGGTDTVLLFTQPGSFPRAEMVPARPVVITAAATVGPLGPLGARESSAYLRRAGAAVSASAPFSARDHFDLDRVRRMDRAARLLTLAMKTALGEAGAGVRDGCDLGAVGGAAYGSVDSSAEFIQRIYEKGPRLASPLIFPNLVPSSPVGHASIYLGLRGPVLSTADLGVTGEAAFALGCLLVEGGEAPAMLAGCVEERSEIAERVLGPVCAGSAQWAGTRAEGASCVLLEDQARAQARGAPVLCAVAYVAAGRGTFAADAARIPPPRGPSMVVVARSDEATRRALALTSWADRRCVELSGPAGNHEGLGGFAIVCAAAAIADGSAEQALVLGLAPDRWVAIVLSRT
jgi:3-oxoacyl-[acyl-carrier-protein] synthase II